MDKYERLSELLNVIFMNGWKPRGETYKPMLMKNYGIYSAGKPIWCDIRIVDVTYSVHDLFSKESWLSDMLDWKDNKPWYIETDIRNYYPTETEYHYMIMWIMTANEKIDYVLNNIDFPIIQT